MSRRTRRSPTATAARRLTVAVCDQRGRPIRAAALSRWLSNIAPPRARGIVNIAIVSDARIRALNRQYRGKDYVTDVLSFPADVRWSGRKAGKGGRGRKRRSFPIPPTLPVLPLLPVLGDIVIARGVARRQARHAGHPEPTELKILALHGLLHLLGYDHERDNGQMRRTERRLLRQGGLGAGLIERS